MLIEVIGWTNDNIDFNGVIFCCCCSFCFYLRSLSKNVAKWADWMRLINTMFHVCTFHLNGVWHSNISSDKNDPEKSRQYCNSHQKQVDAIPIKIRIRWSCAKDRVNLLHRQWIDLMAASFVYLVKERIEIDKMATCQMVYRHNGHKCSIKQSFGTVDVTLIGARIAATLQKNNRFSLTTRSTFDGRAKNDIIHENHWPAPRPNSNEKSLISTILCVVHSCT